MKGEVGLYISNSALNALQKPNCKGHFSQWVLYFVIFGIRKKVASQCDGKHLQNPTTKVIRQN